MKRTRSLFAVALLGAAFTYSSTASADGGRATTPKRAKKKTVHTAKAKSKSKVVKKAKNYDFTGDEIDADRIGPDNTTVFGLQNVAHKSLIRIRSEFIGEIVKSAEML